MGAPGLRAAFGRLFSIHVAFEIGVILKGLNGLLELIGGVLLLVFPPSAIREFIVNLSHNPSLAPHVSPQGERFAAIYLLAHGLVKAFLVYGLLQEKRWVFPWAIVVFTGFGVYQVVRYFIQPSGWLIALTVLDVFVILLTFAEWHRLRKQRASERA